MTRTGARGKSNKSGLVSAILKGVLSALIFGAVTVLALCAVAMKFPDPDKVSPVFGVMAMLITAFFGGYVTSRFHGEKGLSTGALFGLIMILLIAVSSLIAGEKIATSVFSILAPVAILVAGLGGIVGVGERAPKKKKKKRKSF